MKDSKNIFRKLVLIGIGLCAACCLLPIAAVTFGIGALTALSAYLEWVGILAMIVAVMFFAFYYFRTRQAPSCDTDCACKDDKSLSKVE